jgi:hypothetical protein
MYNTLVTPSLYRLVLVVCIGMLVQRTRLYLDVVLCFTATCVLGVEAA